MCDLLEFRDTMSVCVSKAKQSCTAQDLICLLGRRMAKLLPEPTDVVDTAMPWPGWERHQCCLGDWSDSRRVLCCSAGAPGMDGHRVLTPDEQRRFDKARRDFQIERALQGEGDTEPHPDELEELSEAYRWATHPRARQVPFTASWAWDSVPSILIPPFLKSLFPKHYWT